MGWSIAKLSNTVQVSPAIARELIAKFPSIPVIDVSYDEPDCPGGILMNGVLYFSQDHQEFMNWLTLPMCEFLASQNVQGDITFGSLQGDNAGCFWGFRFDGKGGFKKLTGSVTWAEVE